MKTEKQKTWVHGAVVLILWCGAIIWWIWVAGNTM